MSIYVLLLVNIYDNLISYNKWSANYYFLFESDGGCAHHTKKQAAIGDS